MGRIPWVNELRRPRLPLPLPGVPEPRKAAAGTCTLVKASSSSNSSCPSGSWSWAQAARGAGRGDCSSSPDARPAPRGLANPRAAPRRGTGAWPPGARGGSGEDGRRQGPDPAANAAAAVPAAASALQPPRSAAASKLSRVLKPQALPAPGLAAALSSLRPHSSSCSGGRPSSDMLVRKERAAWRRRGSIRGFLGGSGGGGWAGVAAAGGGGCCSPLVPTASVPLPLQAAVLGVAAAAAIVYVCGDISAVPGQASGARVLSGGRERRRPGLGRARGAGGVRGGPAPPRAGHARPSVLGRGTRRRGPRARPLPCWLAGWLAVCLSAGCAWSFGPRPSPPPRSRSPARVSVFIGARAPRSRSGALFAITQYHVWGMKPGRKTKPQAAAAEAGGRRRGAGEGGRGGRESQAGGGSGDPPGGPGNPSFLRAELVAPGARCSHGREGACFPRALRLEIEVASRIPRIRAWRCGPRRVMGLQDSYLEQRVDFALVFVN